MSSSCKPRKSRKADRIILSALVAALCWAQAAQAQYTAVAPTPERVSAGIDEAFQKLAGAAPVKRLLDAVKADHQRSLEDLRLLTEIEAPPFKEQRRAEVFLARMKAVGMRDAAIDAEGNVVALRKGQGGGPKLLVSAHLDTVFPAGTDVRIKERDGKLYAPGIADDGRALTVLLSWLKVLNEQGIQTVGDLLVVALTGEEELGDLRGVKRIFAEHRDIDGMVGLEPAADGGVQVMGTASHRFEFTFKGPGGHSFVAFGQVPSAIHGLGRAIAKIADIQTSSFPKTTFTVGTIGGGTSVNTIAPEARMAVDIRSDDMGLLMETERQILAAVDQAVAEENKRWGTSSLAVTRKMVGDRPGGRTPSDAAVVQAAISANAAFGRKTMLVGGSADANVPMALGIPAITISGGGKSGGFHTLAEWFDPTDAWQGAQSSLLTVLGLVGVQGVSEPQLAKRPHRAR